MTGYQAGADVGEHIVRRPVRPVDMHVECREEMVLDRGTRRANGTNGYGSIVTMVITAFIQHVDHSAN